MISNILYENIDKNENRTALIEGDYRLSYSDLCRIINSLSDYLLRSGIKKGDKVCLYLPNSAEFVAGFFSITSIGAVCVPVNAKYKTSELKQYISYSDANFLLSSTGLLEVTGNINPGVKTIVIKGESASWDITNKEEINFEINESITEEDKAIYLFSTGSTGVPKCIARSHKNLLALAENHTSTVGWDSSDKILFVIPISHTYAFGNLISALKIGATIYLIEDFNRKAVVDTIVDEKITIFPAVPFMLDILSKYQAAKGRKYNNLKHVISAGAPLSETISREYFNTFGIYPRQLYGSSETGVISINMAEEIEKKIQSVGRPVNNVEVKIVDEENKILDSDQPGEIIVKSPSMTDSYENLPVESGKAFRDGYYYTGDIGKKDAEGYIYITGRKKLFINISGQKVDPTEVENVILLNENVSEAVVIGRKNKSGIEYVAAYIVSKENLKGSDIIEFCRDKISDIKIPTAISFVDEIPKSPTGKILREKLK